MKMVKHDPGETYDLPSINFIVFIQTHIDPLCHCTCEKCVSQVTGVLELAR